MKKLFINGKILADGKIREDLQVLCSEKIEKIMPSGLSAGEAEIIDLEGAYLFPGFVDIHIHGLLGCDVMDASLSSLRRMQRALPSFGVTRFLPTTMTMEERRIRTALDTIREAMRKPSPSQGAGILGVHLEGPFLSPKYKGAQDGRFLQKPNQRLIDDYRDILRLITLAVEEDEDFRFIRKNASIPLSIGHSGADFETALTAYDLGVRHCTHLFNGMSPLHHRHPGVVGACFARKYDTELIADGIHIHPGFLETLLRIIGKDRAILISDSMSACGLPEGEYRLGGQKVILKENAPRLEDGSLAGSVLTMADAVRNIRRFTSLPLADIIDMASLHPARSIGAEDLFGSIREGKMADLTSADADLHILKTYVEGTLVYSSGR